MDLYSREWFENHKQAFAKMYFQNDYSITGISIPMNKRTPQLIKDKEEKYDKNEKIDLLWIAAWKMGRLNEQGEPDFNNGIILNGYGKEIIGLEHYIYNINCKKIKELIKSENLAAAFNELANDSPTNFGTVYIINLMHFISEGKIPIYDKFAHKAVKAIFAEVNANKIYVGGPPEKSKVTDAINMLNEYIWLLEKVFGKSNIDRQTDRALWVYGHADKIFDGNF